MTSKDTDESIPEGREGRRAFLRRTFLGMGMLAVGPGVAACSKGEPTRMPPPLPTCSPSEVPLPSASRFDALGPLLAPDENGIRLPAGFRSKVLVRSGETVPGSDYVWHPNPDGGATFPTPDGGHIYVSNSETLAFGGAGALRFDCEDALHSGYPILEGTRVNCAGGATPWGTWLSCEEFYGGQVYECDPFGQAAAIVRPALGAFSHEAVAVDPNTNILYLTEDRPDGRLYRFTPDAPNVGARADLSAGTLEALKVDSGLEGSVSWVVIPAPSAVLSGGEDTRHQAPTSTPFAGGEGIDFFETDSGERLVYFTTKGDNRVWCLDIGAADLSLLYDASTSPTPILTGVDNLLMSAAGDVLVAEDGGDLQIIALTPSGGIVPILQVVGQDHSEITGPAFSPSRTRLYFSSQRGGDGGITYCVEGPFLS